MWTAIKDFSGLDDVPTVPTPFTFAQHVETAREFRKQLDIDCNRTACAVCSSYCRKTDVNTYNINNIPNLSLLDASLPKSTALPRDALTTFTWRNTTYCLQPEACEVDDEQCRVTICCLCHSDLKKKRVPEMSLVSFDTGKTVLIAL